jgi:hypothetical protein
MQAAAKLGISITISQVGSDTPSENTATVSSTDRKEWQPTFSLDEDGLLSQLRATLLQALDASTCKLLHHKNFVFKKKFLYWDYYVKYNQLINTRTNTQENQCLESNSMYLINHYS